MSKPGRSTNTPNGGRKNTQNACVAEEVLCVGLRQPYRDLSGDTILQRLFSTFPAGKPGTALLLMRAVVGATASAQSILYLVHGSNRTFGMLLACLTMAGCGVCLLIGFLTPVASIAIAIVSLAIALSWLPIVAGTLLDGTLASFEMIVMAAAIALLGPGAYSLDALLFGRHEIVIPPAPRSPKP